jgi:Archaeal fructose 1,6-bisphosphatase
MTSSEKITISVLKADIGSLVGNSNIPEIFEETASDILDKYKGEKYLIILYHMLGMI